MHMVSWSGETPFQLLVAVILSAQTTDKAVNKVTPGLWARYPEIEDLASANLDDVEMCKNHWAI